MGADFPNVIVAQIIAANRHPNADRLSVCQVNDGSGQPRRIVCGAKNYVIGDKVPLALPGAVLAGRLEDQGEANCAAWRAKACFAAQRNLVSPTMPKVS